MRNGGKSLHHQDDDIKNNLHKERNNKKQKYEKEKSIKTNKILTFLSYKDYFWI